MPTNEEIISALEEESQNPPADFCDKLRKAFPLLGCDFPPPAPPVTPPDNPTICDRLNKLWYDNNCVTGP